MDPKACLDMILGSLEDLYHDPSDAESREEATWHLRSLADWLEKGGYPPVVDI